MNPEISIICNTYNHEKYIAQTLDSFLMQKVNVPFEIQVHDDASTDSTAEILRDYAQKNPDVILLMLQNQNHLALGLKDLAITPERQLPRAKGKYVAFCEGDDYWSDTEKLQLQYDFMEQHPEYSICCHAYSMVDKDGNLIEERYDLDADGVVPIEMLIGNQLLVPHFATLFARRECLQGLGSSFLGKHCSDMILRLYCQAQKPIYYLNRNMSCYRRFTENSWTVKVGQNREKFLAVLKDNAAFLERYDAYTEGRYSEAIRNELTHRRFEIALLEGDYRAARKNPAYREASLKRKLGITVGTLCPKLMDRIRRK